jgi:hypothetical protein
LYIIFEGHSLLFILILIHLNVSSKELEGAEKLVLSVENEDGVRTVIEELLDAAKNRNPGLRKVINISSRDCRDCVTQSFKA